MKDSPVRDTAVRLAAALQHAFPSAPPIDTGDNQEIGALELLLLAPNDLRAFIEDRYAGHALRVRVTGTLDRRLVLVETGGGWWTLADLSGQPHAGRAWPAWTCSRLLIEKPDSWLSAAVLDECAVERLSKPDVLLAALYHPENFPLPRFPLGISDVARAARATLTGTVGLVDMQLGTTLEDLLKQVTTAPPDILGISATFGQHDLLEELLDAAYALPEPPLVIAGGSLVARNERLLLATYPKLLIARSAGEPTMRGLLAYWHGEIPLTDIPGLGYNGAPRGGGLGIAARRTAKLRAAPAGADILPELDLLRLTLVLHGVAQLEMSRGCTNTCSFCPRGHKGVWNGPDPLAGCWILAWIRRVFDEFPQISWTAYLVDEEIIGRGEQVVARILALAAAFHRAGFRWESSCRIDQVTHPEMDETWHIERVAMWRTLQDLGLRRMLFGVESGVDSILERFNKENTAAQNAVAIRTLSALGVPTRYTYITFDPLMTLEELKQTYAFQGRTDLLLRPQRGLAAADLVAGVRDEAWVAEHTTGRPLHTGISYMLVSIECLVGAAYTRMAAAENLTGAEEPLMGRVACRYRDWRIGVASSWAQRWVDRHFALDYTFKSLEKVLDGAPRHAVRQARIVLKDAAYQVLGDMISAIEQHGLDQPEQERELVARIEAALEERAGSLRGQMASTVQEVTTYLTGEHAATLAREYRRWEAAAGWELINAADSCAD
ncbi:B12-binding domain-containing radical SAM protein [Streptomyces noboritoensis]|uniref:B12-binding domain-containing radical SAM protein n=1 Tax=Streptomyces noboritoensis TaxID=67337 RepID=A0ABV6TCH8_9ACTN